MGRHKTRTLKTLSDLTLDPANPNRGTPRGRRLLGDSLRAYGAGRAILTDGRGRTIAGNKTLEAARALGLPVTVVPSDGRTLVVVQRTDLDLSTDPCARALAIADNRIAELGLEWDAEVLQHLQADGLDLSGFWTDAEFAALLNDTGTGAAEEQPVVVPTTTTVRRGDLFHLGRHRLLCGDATSAADVTRLLDGEVPLLMVTDPPYGVRYDPAWRHRARPSQRTAVGRVRNDDRADWTDAWRLFPGPVTYVFDDRCH